MVMVWVMPSAMVCVMASAEVGVPSSDPICTVAKPVNEPLPSMDFAGIIFVASAAHNASVLLGFVGVRTSVEWSGVEV